MTHGDALIRAALAAPDDDTPRLAFADWCDEQGTREGRDRTEFIRAQITIAHLPPTSMICDRKGTVLSHAGGAVLYQFRCRCRPCSLARREYLASRRHIVWDWCEDIPRGAHNTYRRGFVEETALPGIAWVQAAPEILAAHPIRRVVLRTVPVVAGEAYGELWLGGDPEHRSFTREQVAEAGMGVSAVLHLRYPGIVFTLPPG